MSASPPVSGISPPSLPPPPEAPGNNSQTNASSDPPSSSPPPVSSAAPPSFSPPPPLLSGSPPPASSPPPAVSSPPPSSTPRPPPPLTVTPPTASQPPPSTGPPPPASQPPPPIVSPPPAPQLPPPTLTPPPASQPPPPTATPPPASQPPPPLSASPPTTPISPPPAVAVPPPPSQDQSPPPPSSTPSEGSSPIPSLPPPPSPQPPKSPSPPSNPSPPATPPIEQPPTSPSPPSSPPNNSSSVPPSIEPSTPPSPHSSLPTPPSNSPGFPSLNPPSFPANPISPGAGRSSTPSSNDSLVQGSGGAGGGGSKTGFVVPVAVILALVVLSVVGISVWFMSKRKKKSSSYAAGFSISSPVGSSQFSGASASAPLFYHSSGTYGGSPNSINSQPEPGLGNSKSWFSFEELHQITDAFSEQNLLGEGGFGSVYKGILPDGREVAVKQLKIGGGQGEREFKAEVEIISRVHHRHLVSLVGYCIEENQRLLVYDFVPNDTLHYHLHGQGNPVMDWEGRIRVAAGAARGIAYLHEDCHPRIIHRDIKSSNILLDNNFEAQVSDFGLARLAMDAWTHVTTRVMGTFGYLAPEYASTGKLTEKSDVFSFGVVLLELITGRKPVDSSQPLGDESLVEWARPLLANALESGDFGALADPRLENNYNMKEMFRMIEAAAACIRHSASLRPRMSLVVRALDSLADIDLSNGITPGQSELFNTGPQSEEIRMFQRMAFGSQNFSMDNTRSTRSRSRDL